LELALLNDDLAVADLPAAWRSRSGELLGVLWENHVGRRPAFWGHLRPKLDNHFPRAASGAEELIRRANWIKPSPLRVGADELSYHLHILMRYELELALLNDDLAVADLPAAWRSRSGELLGVYPTTSREGALQDIHWSLGLFGYFSSYSIGSLYAAQLIETYEHDHDLDAEIERGEMGSLRTWLKANVFERSATTSGEDIVRAATGRGLDAGAFFRHANRVLSLFGPLA
jgi:carboxypeptidase Taq